MFGRIRLTMLAATAAGLLLVGFSSAAHASVLSLLPGSCGAQQESQPFAQWGDHNNYTLVPGGAFTPGSPDWLLLGGARTGSDGSALSGYSLSLPAASLAMSQPACTGLDHPSMRFFVRNTGSSTSRLNVFATYPTLLGPVTVLAGQTSGSSTWEPSPALQLTLGNIVGTLSLTESTVSFTFVPADNTGDWSVDDVYIDPFCRS